MIPPFGNYLVGQVGLEPTTGRLWVLAKQIILKSTK